jgi:predicted transposase YbfD/YdcC
MLPTILAHFADLEDPRVDRTRLHPLPTILGIALCAVICGADSWVEIEACGKAKQDWLQEWLSLPNGIPSHDTCACVFARLQPQALGACLQNLTRLLVRGLEKQISLDGKYLCHSFDTDAQQGPLVMLNAWASCQRLVLASVPVDLKSNEIKAVPSLLALLAIAGCTVALDAMGCQTAIAAQIIEQEGDYVLALKGNQESVHADVRLFFEHALETRFENIAYHEVEESDCGHGRPGRRLSVGPQRQSFPSAPGCGGPV